MVGKTLSHYRILGVLGAGGMGVVYLAEDQRLGRQVAIKCLPADAVEHPQALDRFRLEARTASSLSHPNICAIHDIGVHEDAPYIVMELLKGETLRERVSRGHLKIVDVLDITIQLADALGAAHAQGIVHRDIKPANIFVGDRLRVKILDFGLAKLAREHSLLSTGAAVDVTAAPDPSPRIANQLTAPGTAIGTVSYMSPEQARGEDVDARTDIFSLGVVLYEMVTGRQAFSGSTSAVVFDAILNRAPTSPVLFNPETPSRLVDAINTALEKERDLRYQHSVDFEADLKRIRRDLQSGATSSAPTMTVAAAAATIGGVGSAATATTAPVPSSGTGATAATPAPRSTWPLWVGALALVAALGVVGYTMWGRAPAGTESGEQLRRAHLYLDTQDFRSALAEASALLARDPGNADAAGVKAAAEQQLAALDRLVAAAQQALAAGDRGRVAQILADARAIAPADARLADLAAQLGERAAAAPSRDIPASTPAVAPPPAAASSRPAATRPAPEPPRPAASTATPPAPTRAVPTPAPPASTPAQPPSQPAPTTVPPAAVSPPVTTAPPPVVETPPPPPAPAEPAPRPSPPPPVATTTTPPAATTPAPSPPATPAADTDEVAITRLIERYERAIENKDLALFRAVRPGLTADEERRLRTAFEQVGRQQIEMRIVNQTVTGDTAVVRVARLDVVETGGRTQTSRSTQTLRLSKRGGNWVIVELGR